jgi:hypothetical protein
MDLGSVAEGLGVARSLVVGVVYTGVDVPLDFLQAIAPPSGEGQAARGRAVAKVFYGSVSRASVTTMTRSTTSSPG